VEPLSVARALAALQEALYGNDVQVVALDADWDRLLSQFPAGQEPAFLSRLLRRTAKPAVAQGFLRIARSIQTASGDERRALVADYIRGQVAKVLGHASSDAVDTRTPLTDMGFDSLMVIELSNSITSLMGEKYEPSALLDTPTIEQLAVAVAGRMSASASRETSGVA
jgi:acyl carrier protein